MKGILTLVDLVLRELVGIKFFANTDTDVHIFCRVMWDMEKRGRSLDSVVQQYLTIVKSVYEQFAEPSKRYADPIVSEGGRSAAVLDMITQRVKSHTERE